MTVECKYTNALGGGACFPTGTLIKTPYGEVPIETLKVGDEVVAFDKDKPVKSIVTGTKSLYHTELFLIETPSGEVRATGNHEFYNGKEYVRADKLRVGDVVYRYSTILLPEKVLKITKLTERVPVYDLEVEKYHNFFADGFAVHNILISGSTTAHIDHVQIKIYYTKTFHPW